MLQFSYDGKIRVAEPHVLGMSNGIVQLLTFQTGGFSSSGGLPDWRRFDVNNIHMLSILPQTFQGQRRPPAGRHSHWDLVYLIVQ